MGLDGNLVVKRESDGDGCHRDADHQGKDKSGEA